MKKGFSLIELLVVLAITAILAAIAIPAYQTYVTRVEMTKIVKTAMDIGNQIKIKYQATGIMPTSFTYKNLTIPQNTWIDVYDEFASHLWYRVYSQTQAGIQIGIPETLRAKLIGRTDNSMAVIIYENPQSVVNLVCTNGGAIPLRYMPANCITGVNLNSGNPQF